MSANHVLGAGEASAAIARVTLTRTLRGKSVWIGLGLCVLPVVFGLLTLGLGELAAWRAAYSTTMLLVMLLPPILLAHTIGEEIEERTMAYLWSRPLPRWSILLGKMVALTPILSFLMCLALVVPFFVLFGGAAGDHVDLLTGAMLSVVVATIAASGVTAGLATLVPRFGTVLGIGYLVLVDGTLAAIDTSISKLSVTYNAAALSGSYDPANYASIGWLAGITAVWLGVAAWRIRRIE